MKTQMKVHISITLLFSPTNTASAAHVWVMWNVDAWITVNRYYNRYMYVLYSMLVPKPRGGQNNDRHTDTIPHVYETQNVTACIFQKTVLFMRHSAATWWITTVKNVIPLKVRNLSTTS